MKVKLGPHMKLYHYVPGDTITIVENPYRQYIFRSGISGMVFLDIRVQLFPEANMFYKTENWPSVLDDVHM
jgi:hypothetical protein